MAQAEREQARSVALSHSVSIEETENSILFISSHSPIRGNSLDHSLPLQIQLDGEVPIHHCPAWDLLNALV